MKVGLGSPERRAGSLPARAVLPEPRGVQAGPCRAGRGGGHGPKWLRSQSEGQGSQRLCGGVGGLVLCKAVCKHVVSLP